MNNKITIFTDGACSGNPGPGGWGALLIYVDKAEKELFGYSEMTTNNRMELLAVINSLEYLPQNSSVDIYTDSIYVKNGITVWLDNWIKNNWRTANKKPVKNIDLWQQLKQIISNHNVNFYWIKGHSGNPGNEKADALARKAMQDNF